MSLPRGGKIYWLCLEKSLTWNSLCESGFNVNILIMNKTTRNEESKNNSYCTIRTTFSSNEKINLFTFSGHKCPIYFVKYVGLNSIRHIICNKTVYVSSKTVIAKLNNWCLFTPVYLCCPLLACCSAGYVCCHQDPSPNSSSLISSPLFQTSFSTPCLSFSQLSLSSSPGCHSSQYSSHSLSFVHCSLPSKSLWSEWLGQDSNTLQSWHTAAHIHKHTILCC